MGLWPNQGGTKCLGPAAGLYGTVTLSFVIPSEAEGSAVSFRSRQLLGHDKAQPHPSPLQQPFLHFARIAACSRSRRPAGSS
jgi:hypothetical protein